MADKQDRISFNPHARFVSSSAGEKAAEYRKTMLQADIQSASVHVVAEMVRLGYTREHLNGALAFLDLFMNFSEPPVAPKTLPQHALRQP